MLEETGLADFSRSGLKTR